MTDATPVGARLDHQGPDRAGGAAAGRGGAGGPGRPGRPLPARLPGGRRPRAPPSPCATSCRTRPGCRGARCSTGPRTTRALARRVAALRDVGPHRGRRGRGTSTPTTATPWPGWSSRRWPGGPTSGSSRSGLFAPLGMTGSTFDPARAAAGGLAQGYTKRRGDVGPIATAPSRGIAPAGMAFSTARDAGRYLLALLQRRRAGGRARRLGGRGRRAVDAPGRRRRRRRLRPGLAAPGGSRGCGWSSTGATCPGAARCSCSSRTAGVAVGVLANLAGPEKEAVAEDVLRLVLGGEPAARPAPPDWRAHGVRPRPGDAGRLRRRVPGAGGAGAGHPPGRPAAGRGRGPGDGVRRPERDGVRAADRPRRAGRGAGGLPAPPRRRRSTSYLRGQLLATKR